MIKISIVGLPNVGKSALFNLITKNNILSSNYPFATINPNIAIVPISDPRCLKLKTIYNSKKIIYSTLKFYDIAGLVKNASKGEGLGNKFLATIKETDIICHVVRLFENKKITHVYKKVDPASDYEIINSELILHDIELINKVLLNIEKNIKKTSDKTLIIEKMIIKKAILYLEKEKLLNKCDFSSEEKLVLFKAGLLTIKPMIILLNISENILKNIKTNMVFNDFTKFLDGRNEKWTSLAIKLENDIEEFSDGEKKIILQEYKINKGAFWKFTWQIFKILNLSVFFTCGEMETHSWMFNKKNNTSIECASLIHTSFYKRFICAEIFNYKLFNNYKTEKDIRNKGLLKKIGKDNIINDGDICNFILNKE